MESWDLVVVGAGCSALRAAIQASDSGATPIVIDGSGVGSASGAPPVAGLAASIDELDSNSHRDDTISLGGESTDTDAADRICGEGVSTLAELERWGLVLRRRKGGLPHASNAPWHNSARLTGCGDSTVREVVRILEEQLIKRGIQRRSDLVPISLVSDNQQVRGITVLDTITGELMAIQAKAVILATEGHQGLWNSPAEGSGTGSALALGAGLELKGMQFHPKHPLTIRGYNIHIPFEVLGEGGRIRRESGEDVGPEEVLEGESCVLDLRHMPPESKPWFSQTTSRVSERLGVDISKDVLPIEAGFAVTTGGIPTDEFGRVVFDGFTPEGLPGKMWFTGLYAAGRSSNNGMHGQSLLPGNLMLDDLVSGKAAGGHSAGWIEGCSFGGGENISAELKNAEKLISDLHSESGLSIGQASTKLASAMKSACATNGSSNPSAATSAISEIRENGIRVTDQSSVMNTELTTAIRLMGLVSIAESIIESG